MRAEIEKVVVAWALLFGFTLFSMSFEIFFCNLNFWILTPASEITLQFFSGTPFRSWTFWTYIVTMKYELYQNLGPLRSILRALEHKMPGGGRICPPPVQSRVKLCIRCICKWIQFVSISRLTECWIMFPCVCGLLSSPTLICHYVGWLMEPVSGYSTTLYRH